MLKQSEPRFLTAFQAACLSDSFGRANIINILYDHPQGITFRGIKRIEDQNRKHLYPEEQAFHKIQKSQLQQFLNDIVAAELAIEKAGYYDLIDWFRKFLDQIMERVRMEHPELFSQRKKGV